MRINKNKLYWATYVACVVSGSAYLPEGNMALADVTPYALVGVTHDDNLFRLSDDADTVASLGTDERADTYRVLEAGADLNAQISRQRLHLHADVMQTQFSNFTFLDNTGGHARARWDWSVLSNASGRLGYDYQRTLASLETQSAAGRNVRSDQHPYAEADLRFAQRLRLRVGASERMVENSLETQRALDTRATTVESALHLLGAPTPGTETEPNFFGARVRATRGDYPYQQMVGGTAVDNSYDERETGAVVGWRFADGSQVQAFSGYTEREYEQFPVRDFAGATGRVDADWQVGAKTQIALALWRELTVADDQSAGYVLSHGVSLGPDWSMTRKITLKGRAGYETRDYRGDAALALGIAERRKDEIVSYRLGLDYEPVPPVRFGLAWKAAERESNRALSDYRYHSVMATLRAQF